MVAYHTGMASVNDIIYEAARRLAGHGMEAARLEAEILCAHVLGTDRTAVIVRGKDTVDAATAERFFTFVERRLGHEPVAYITGRREFFGMDFRVTPDVLIPRPETEELVELAMASISANERILDAGTGSGCIAVSLARYCHDAAITAIDISPAALAIAKANADRLLGSHSVRFLEADMRSFVPEKPFTMVISNPPYIADGDIERLAPDIGFEPRLALAGGPTGVEFIGSFADNIGRVLSPGGRFFLEIGNDADGVIALFRERGYTCSLEFDLSGKARFVKGQL